MLLTFFSFLYAVSLLWKTQLSISLMKGNYVIMHQSLNTTNLVVQLDDAVQRWSINNTFHYAVVGENYSVTAISTFLDSEYEFIRHFVFVTPSLNDYAVQSHYCIES